MTTLIKGLLLAGCIIPMSSLAQRSPRIGQFMDPRIGRYMEMEARIGQYMKAQIAVNDFSGVVLASAKGKIVYRQPFGHADREWKIPNTPQSKFEIGSLTKQFTAAAILRLAEQHKLNLSDNLSDYFPGYPKGDSITLHMLFNHTSGITNYTEISGFNTNLTLPLPKDSMIAILSRQPLTSSPGTKFRYSNSGYFLLGCIIEKVTKMPYHKYIEDTILTKAGLTNTLVNRTDSILSQRTRGYTRSQDGRWSNAPYLSMEIPFSAGALISTSDDLLAWQNALWAGRIISNESLVVMTTPYLGHYGYALNIDSFAGHRRVWHSGAIPGYTAQFCHFPAEDITIIVLSNDEGYVGQITDAVASILFGLPVRMPHIQKEISVQGAVLKRYAGNYSIDQTSGTLQFELLVENDKLYLKPRGANFKMELKPESETLFFLARDHDQEFEFLLDKTGNISNGYFNDRDVRLEIKKL